MTTQPPAERPLPRSARDVLLGVAEKPPERVDVTALVLGPLSDGECYEQHFYVQELCHADRTQWFRDNASGKGADDANERLVLLTLVDGQGNRVLTSADLPALKKRSALVSKLSSVAQEVSALFWRAEEWLKANPTISPSNGRQREGDAP